MSREHLPSAAHGEPICDANDPDDPYGFVCMRRQDHEGAHAAHGLDDEVLHVWPEDGAQ